MTGPGHSATDLADIWVSRSEAEALCAKAGRGAGMSWGHAEEAGFAVGWLIAQGLDGMTAFARHLNQADGAEWRDVSPLVAPGRWLANKTEPLCPIATGTALSDFAGLDVGLIVDQPLVVGPISEPLLILPFAATISRRIGQTIEVSWGGDTGASIQIDPTGISGGDLKYLAASPAATLCLSTGFYPGTPPQPPRPVAVTAATLARLEDFALRTTVPATDQSRAGAGSANDAD